jgi:hypothetical protein
VANPHKRITIREIRHHPWFLKNLPRELMEGADAGYPHDDYNNPPQPTDEILRIIEEGKVPLPTPKTLTPYLWEEDEDELEEPEEPEEEFYADEDEVEAFEREKGTQERVGGAHERVGGAHERVGGAQERVGGVHERVGGAYERETAHERGEVRVRFQEAEKAHDRADVHARGAEKSERTSYHQPK